MRMRQPVDTIEEAARKDASDNQENRLHRYELVSGELVSGELVSGELVSVELQHVP